MKRPSKLQTRTTYTRVEGFSDSIRIPRLGKIRLGVKVKKAVADTRCKHDAEGNCFYCTYPKDVNYFVCPPEVQEVYGEKPVQIDVLLPCEDQGLFFPQALKWYEGARLRCKGNGVMATRLNPQTGEMNEMECPCEMLKTRENPKGPCDIRANLMVILPRVSISGCYQIDTGSQHGIIGINSYLEWLRGAVYRVSYVPLHMVREKETIQYTEASGAAKSGPRWIIKIRLPKDMDYKKLAAFRERDIIAIEGGQSLKVRPALPPAPVEDGEDQALGAVLEEEQEQNGEIEALEEKTEPEDAQGAEIEGAAEAEPAQKEPPAEKKPLPPGPKVSTPRANIIRAMFVSKGIDKELDMDATVFGWYGVGVKDLPASLYDECKDKIAALQTGK